MLEDWKQSILALADIFVQKSDVPGAESGSSPAERKSRSDWCCSMCVVESESQRGLSQRCTAPAGAGRLAKSQPAEGVAWNERGGTGSQGDSEESQDEEGGEDNECKPFILSSLLLEGAQIIFMFYHFYCNYSLPSL